MPDDIEMIADWRRFPAVHRVTGAEIAPAAGVVAVRWDDGRSSPFHFDWLRDNCPCRLCVHPLTREQVFEIVDAPDDLAPARVETGPDGGLALVWADGHHSRFGPGWLRANAYDPHSRAERSARPPARLWDAGLGDHPPSFDMADLERDGPEFHDWLVSLRDLGLTLIRGAPREPGFVARLARRIAFVRETSFGVIFDVQSKPRPDSNAYTAIDLPPHTDLPTRELQPGLQILHCLANTASGGDSIFVDGFAVAERLRRDGPEDFAVLTGAPITFWNRDADSDYRWSAPIIALDAQGAVAELRHANFLRGPIDAPAEAMPAIYRAYRRFVRLTREPGLRVVRRLDPGEAWVFDNRRVLHARTAFDAASGERHLQGCYIDRDALLSRIRVLERTA